MADRRISKPETAVDASEGLAENIMKPFMLKGHEKPLSCVRFNADGDLIASAAAESSIVLWSSTSGERLGTYEGHEGAVTEVAFTRDSKYLLSSAADATCRIWEVESGRLVHTISLGRMPGRCAAWSQDEDFIAVGTANFATMNNKVLIYGLPSDMDESALPTEPLLEIEDDEMPRDAVTVIAFKPSDSDIHDDGVLVGRESGRLMLYDHTTGELKASINAHTDVITGISFNHDRTLFITSSADKTCKLWCSLNLSVMFVYEMDTRINAAVISPRFRHVFMGGGQEARDVTTTDASAGHFETRVYDLIDATELARFGGHFGPINSISVSPDGTQLATGSQDGYLRLSTLPPAYERLGDDEDLHAVAVQEATKAYVREKMDLLESTGEDLEDDDRDAIEEEAFLAAERTYEEVNQAEQREQQAAMAQEVASGAGTE